MKIGTLLMQTGTDVPCVIFPTKRALFPNNFEVMVYAKHRLFKGYLKEDYVAELETLVDWCIIPELEEMLCDSKK